jgi:hypothetical protein
MTIFSAINLIAERRIEEAIKDGKLNHPAWRNRPLPVEESPQIPNDLKMAYKILKNSGFLPPEIETRKEIKKLEELIASTEDEHTRVKQIKKLNFLVMKLNNYRSSPATLTSNNDYHRLITEKITINKSSGE